jgi:hypothetical protein
MRHAGHLVLAGPFSDQPDDSLRGLCIYRTSWRTPGHSRRPTLPCRPGAWRPRS